ncbi:M1 family aminopeptidase [Neolewinella lacunae]|uniref:Peptidase M1 n=1 Tax=Neolewinella lacunae TaxID=1517758 RepID=A0A923PQL5_9BACT|nr:M1 family aminopeptidase [Neolewinella lacunae]MBC6995674.1 peptidase M1 [Neolewinella lacunae]MDN3636633.1 M1 family aminopeptidase [Neolewinella lacunae]
MFLEILKFELKYRFTRPATWAYFGILLLFGFLLAANGANASSEKAFANSAVTVANLLMTVSIFGVLIASAVMGVPVYRDIEHGVQDYYFTYPVSEKGYLLGRYAGSLVTLLAISLGVVLGLMIGYSLGPLLEWEEPERFGPLRLADYVYGTTVYLWPNLIFTGTFFFCLVALTRKIFVSYVGSILFFIVYLVAGTLASDLENQSLVSLIDPFGLFGFQEVTKYLTPPEQNTFHAPLTGNLLINRLLWPGIALALLLFTLFRFEFVRFLGGKAEKVKKAVSGEFNRGAAAGAVPIPPVQQRFDGVSYVRHMFAQAWIEFKSILRDPYFAGIISGALLFLFFDGWFGSTIYGTPSLPTTYTMLEMKNETYIFFVLVILVFYTGEVVHRDRTVKFDQISDALPVPSWAIYGGKLMTMVLVTFLLVTMVWILGVFNQTVQGYFDYDFGQYFTDLYLLTWPQYLVLMSLAFFVHVLVNSKFLGHVVAIGTYAVVFFVPAILEIDYNMFLFGSRPGYLISDMNGFGHFVRSVSWFNVYWLAFGTVLLILSGLFWARGTDNAWKSRFQRFGQDWGLKPALGIAAALAVFALSGFTIYNNVSVKNTYTSNEESLDQQEAFEKSYRKYDGFLQPKITDTELFVDLVPEQRNVKARGLFRIKNKGATAIDTLLINHSYDQKTVIMSVFTIDGIAPELVQREEDFDFEIYHLADPLEPGESALMEMVVEGGFGAFPNEGYQRDIVFNGTFLNNSIFPGFGYPSGAGISSDLERKKRGLEIRDYDLPPQDDAQGRATLLFGDDSDFVTFRATVSTAPDQIAIAPGKLTKEYEKDGRRYFEYANEGKIQNFWNISSANYEVLEDVYRNTNGRDVKIQIFHHKNHDRNLDRFMASAKASLAYYARNFSPYQFDQLRILEFPRYATFAQSFPNTVPYAEDFGWTGDFRDPADNDYAFTVTAHEVAHQWWGHQIAPSATRGANQIAETMAEYSSLMVTKERYGEASMGKFLKYELDSYLRGRSGESKFEKTLLDNDTQAYVWYRKGGLIMYALSDYIGEDRLNAGFAAFLDSFALKEDPPFATTADWYGFIQSVTPDSMQYFLRESFAEITLYENRALSAVYAPTPEANGKYRVTLKVDTRKISYEGSGEEKARPTAPSLIEIGVFGPDGTNAQGLVEKQPLFLEKRWLTPGEHTIVVYVDALPEKAGIDPYNKLIDRVADDNLIPVVKE